MRELVQPTNPNTSTSSDGSTTAKRKRGRAPGSKNKPKFPAATPAAPDSPALGTHILQIPAGGDVAKTIAAFARGCRAFGVCVLSASGPIVAAVLWEASPSPCPSALTFHGSFDLLSMTATFLPGGNEGSLAVTLAGPQGQVVGGVVAGPVVAAGTVIVVAATFASPTFHSLNEGCKEENCEEGLSDKYVEQLEEFLDLRPSDEMGFSGVSSDVEEVDRNLLEGYVEKLGKCLENEDLNGEFVREGSYGGNMFDGCYDLPMVVDGGGCGFRMS